MSAKQINQLLGGDEDPSTEEVDLIMSRTFKTAHKIVAEYSPEEIIKYLEVISLAKQKAIETGTSVFISIVFRNQPNDAR